MIAINFEESQIVKTLFALLTSALVVTCASAQDVATTQSGPSEQERVATYFVQISEHRVAEALPTPLDASKVLKMLSGESAGKPLSLVQSVGLSVVAGKDASVKFTRKVGYLSGTVKAGSGAEGKVHNFLQLGTELHVRAFPNNGKIAVELVYDSSRTDGDFSENGVPAVSEIESRSTYHVTPGEPVVVAISGGNETTVVSLILTE